jgi:hypothetical protein
MKQAVRISSRLRRVSDNVKGFTPSKMKEEAAHRVRARDVGALTTLGTFAPIDHKSRMMVIHLD